MKITIKKLQEEKERLQSEVYRLRSENSDLTKEDLKQFNLRLSREKEINDFIASSNRQLLEIVRWHINPDTAKYPFVPEKGQISEDILKRGY